MVRYKTLLKARRYSHNICTIPNFKMAVLLDKENWYRYDEYQNLFIKFTRSKLSEETKAKISEAMKGNQNAKKDYSLVSSSSSSGTGTGSSGMSGVSSSGSGTV